MNQKCRTVRNIPILLDKELAKLLNTNTGSLNRKYKRNRFFFKDFTPFTLSRKEILEIDPNYVRGVLPTAYSEEACKKMIHLFKDKKIHYEEKLIEDFVSKNLAEIDPNLKLHKIQFRIGKGHRPDILAFDENNTPCLIEIQVGTLDRNHLYRSLEYRDLYFLKHQTKPRIILLAEGLKNSHKKILDLHGVEFHIVKKSKEKLIVEKRINHNEALSIITSLFSVSK